jgi:tungstate transport system substrate-binding protein
MGEMKKQSIVRAALAALILPALAYAAGAPTPTQPRLRIATTTSVEASGLLKLLLPEFEKDTGYKTEVVAVGTGAALKLAEAGDVDAVIVHSRQAEQDFIDRGFGINRRELWDNDFVLVGPQSDPAGLRGAKSAAAAFSRIAAGRARFVSRGDSSGTHDRERAIWKKAGIAPAGDWYMEAGSGMDAVLVMADEMNAYTLVDRATWLSFKDKVKLSILYSGDPELLNIYSVIAVNPAKIAGVNAAGAAALTEWLASEKGQRLAAGLMVGGQKLFNPRSVSGGR